MNIAFYERLVDPKFVEELDIPGELVGLGISQQQRALSLLGVGLGVGLSL